MQSINNTVNLFSFTAVAFPMISSSAALMKLLLAIDIQVTTVALSPPLPACGREPSRPLMLPPISHGLGVALELPWSIYCWAGGDALKTGRVTDTFVQFPNYARIFHESLKLNPSLFLGVIHFQVHCSRITHK